MNHEAFVSELTGMPVIELVDLLTALGDELNARELYKESMLAWDAAHRLHIRVIGHRAPVAR